MRGQQLDISVTDHRWDCRPCRRRHAPGSPCPPVGVWLVLTLCRTCDPKAERYCSRHRDRTALTVVPAPVSGLPEVEEGAAS